jgi:hypothetical protein
MRSLLITLLCATPCLAGNPIPRETAPPQAQVQTYTVPQAAPLVRYETVERVVQVAETICVDEEYTETVMVPQTVTRTRRVPRTTMVDKTIVELKAIPVDCPEPQIRTVSAPPCVDCETVPRNYPQPQMDPEPNRPCLLQRLRDRRTNRNNGMFASEL